MKQRSIVSLEHELKKKSTRREEFLAMMERVVPWADLLAIVDPHYPKAGDGRPPMPLARMLRIYCCQHWFNLSDPGMEDALYDSMALRQFVGLESFTEAVPDESTILKFRHLLEKHGLTEKMFNDVNLKLEQHGLLVRSGTIVDATLIAAPPSTKNKAHERDPEMHQTKKGNQWYFGMKVHVGTDTKRGLVHSLVTTAANVHDSQMMDDLLHGEEEVVYGDSAYASADAKELSEAQDIRWRVHHKAAVGKPLTPRQERENKSRSKVRAMGEHAFGVVKHLWGHRKIRYRGLKKNTVHYFACFSLANLYKVRHHILRLQESYVW